MGPGGLKISADFCYTFSTGAADLIELRFAIPPPPCFLSFGAVELACSRNGICLILAEASEVQCLKDPEGWVVLEWLLKTLLMRIWLLRVG